MAAHRLRPGELVELADHADDWDRLEHGPGRFDSYPGRGGEPPPVSHRRRAAFRRPSRSAIRADLNTARGKPRGFDEEED